LHPAPHLTQDYSGFDVSLIEVTRLTIASSSSNMRTS